MHDGKMKNSNLGWIGATLATAMFVGFSYLFLAVFRLAMQPSRAARLVAAQPIPEPAAPADVGETEQPDDAERQREVEPEMQPVTADVKLPIEVEAERFARGNVTVDESEFGSKDATVIRSEVRPAFVEYDVVLPEAKSYSLKMKYAAFDSRPLTVFINGQKQDKLVAGEQTGGNFGQHQKWFEVGKFPFVAGKNVLRLETSMTFPHLDQLVIAAMEPEVVAEAKPETKPAAKPEPAKPGEAPPPWQTALDDPHPPAFRQVCFDTFDPTKLPKKDDLPKWFDRLSGRWSSSRTRLGEAPSFEGLMRLKAPWREDTALRLSLEAYNLLQIHFFHGRRGVTLAYYENDNDRWAAYTTTRNEGSNQPATYRLAATDDDRARRTEIRAGGPFELRRRDGEMILSRGDIVLLRVPLAEPPDDVFFEGRAAFTGIALLKTKDFTPSNPVRDPKPLVAEIDPASVEWKGTLEPTSVAEKLREGGFQLRAPKAKTPQWVSTPLPKTGLVEVTFELDDATVGAGVFLGRAANQGGPSEVVKFVRNRRATGMCLMSGAVDAVVDADLLTVSTRAVPYTGEQVWIKLLYGCGTLQWWMSQDGEYWVAPERPMMYRGGGLTHAGLFCASNLDDCRVTVNRIVVRQLSRLEALVTDDLKDKAQSQLTADLPTWLTATAGTKPDGVDLATWQRACAVRTLGANCPRVLGHPLLNWLLDQPAVRDLPAAEQFAVLEEASHLFSFQEEVAMLPQLLARFHRVGLAEFSRGQERPFSFVRPVLMTAPFATPYALPASNPDTVRAEMLHLVYRGDWPGVAEFCRQLVYFRQHQQIPLVPWAEVQAKRHLGRQAVGTGLSAGNPNWQHPLVEELDKQTYNLLAELQAILDSDAFDDAGRMLTSLSPDTFVGLSPAGRDRELLLSLPAAVRASVDEYPQLRKLINDKYTALAGLRVRQAMKEGNVAALETAVVQFDSTPAAAEAQQWLGDRALSAGWFEKAIGHYRQAEKSAPVSLAHGLGARIRLASSMLGIEAGAPLDRPVQFGERQLSPTDFEAIVAEMLRRGNRALDFVPREAERRTLLPPSDLNLQRRGKLEGAVGEEPKTEVIRGTRRYFVDWAGQQTATVVDAETLFVSNRFHVAAINLVTGERNWQQTARPHSKMQRAQEWGLMPMRPLVTDRRVFCRQLYGEGPLLVCLDKTNGNLVWNTASATEFVASDPWLTRGRLSALTIKRTEQTESSLRLSTFDVDTGELLSQRDLLRLREPWWTRRCGEVTPLDDSFIATLGGVTFRCDDEGRLRWVRKHIVLPADEEPNWVLQQFDRPLVHGSRVFLSPPGTRAIDCLDAESGRRQWLTVQPDVRRLLGISGDSLLIQTERGFTSLSLATGKSVWTTDLPDLLHAAACDDRHLIASVRLPADDKATKFIPALVWLDATTGRELRRVPLPDLTDPDPRLGPLVPYRDRLWTFFTPGPFDAVREIIELTKR